MVRCGPRRRAEAASVGKAVTHFMRGGVTPAQIGVITPYEGQHAHILSLMQRSGALPAAMYAQARPAAPLASSMRPPLVWAAALQGDGCGRRWR